MTLPNFIIIGAAKSGTTSMKHILAQHPEIFIYLSPKPRFFTFKDELPNYCGPGDQAFNQTSITNIDRYQALFAEVKDQIAIGEKSTSYLVSSTIASERIHQYLPEVKLIAILRHPADRAYSNYLNKVQVGLEKLAFPEALAAEKARQQANWSPSWQYLQNGYYAARLKDYFQYFSPSQIRIFLYEDWTGNPRKLLADLFEFIQVDPGFAPNLNRRYNVAKIPRYPLLSKLLLYPNPLRNLLSRSLPGGLRSQLSAQVQKTQWKKPPALETSLRRQLTDLYRQDILELQSLIGRDLSHWLS